MTKKTLVFGASINPRRYSYLAMQRLVEHGHEVVGFGLKKGNVSGVEIETEPKLFPDIDTITLYMNPQRQVEYYDYILTLNPKRVIFNPGTENPELYEILKENKIEFETACTLILLSINDY